MDISYLIIIIISAYICLTKNPLSAIAASLLLFVTTAFIFAGMNRNFIALSLIIIYLGAILVLVLFVIMLTYNTENFDKNKRKETHLYTTLASCFFIKSLIVLTSKSCIANDNFALHNWKTQLILHTKNRGEKEIWEITRLLFDIEIHVMQICIFLLVISLIVCITIIQMFKQKKSIRTVLTCV